MKLSRNAISFLFFFIAAMPIAYACFIQISEVIIHYAMEEKLEEKNLITIQVDPSQIVWIKQGKEASINGKMFDIKDYFISNNKIKLTGLFDKDEDALFSNMDDMQSKNSDALPVTVLKLFECFSSIHQNINTSFFTLKTEFLKSNLLSCFIQNPFISFDSPPPEFVLSPS